MEIETFCPTSQHDWRQWLTENHYLKQSVWLVYYKKKTNTLSITWSEAVNEALCFGWVDSRRKPIDDQSFMQFFSRRKPYSTWSKINKEKVHQLINNGLMTQAGYNSIEIAKQNGFWTMIDQVEELIIPSDMEEALALQTDSMDYFLSLSKSVRKSILQWILFAKRPETRKKRISQIANLCSQRIKPALFRIF
ncbi:hypothetical protein GJU39_06205 [Pedobacter petrophilus]|uniref:Bacteriocin-protection protein n=1 Tax=Pedobacter petrophilus TaxID=1908241 RepID=A0A7K0FVX3_9SPHI|nr:YdeI/OmpD-associated family protein [Pedobacter petrophilus]MRX75675.1 hypothetical protein [Pedobacter petrophilus]